MARSFIWHESCEHGKRLNTELCFAWWILVSGALADTMLNGQILILMATRNIKIALPQRMGRQLQVDSNNTALKLYALPVMGSFHATTNAEGKKTKCKVS